MLREPSQICLALSCTRVNLLILSKHITDRLFTQKSGILYLYMAKVDRFE